MADVSVPRVYMLEIEGGAGRVVLSGGRPAPGGPAPRGELFPLCSLLSCSEVLLSGSATPHATAPSTRHRAHCSARWQAARYEEKAWVPMNDFKNGLSSGRCICM